jgi:hypothetical protein
VTFFTPKLMKIRWSPLFFGSFALHFQIKLNTHGSNFNSIFVIMNELEFFLLTRVLTQNFNAKFLKKNKKTSHLNCSSHIAADIMHNHEQEKKVINLLNKTWLQTHTELELDVLGILGKLVKYVVYSSQGKKLKKK